MIFSVYRPELKQYDYYERAARLEDAKNPAGDDLSRRHTRLDGQDLGVSSEQAGYHLPPGCLFVGRGDAPRGMVATRSPAAAAPLGGVAELISMRPWAPWAVAAALGYLWWRNR